MTIGSSFPTIPVFTLPQFVARMGSKLPQWPHSVILATALNAARKLNVLPPETLQQLEGRHFRVTVLDAGSVVDFAYREGSFRPLFNPLGKPDIHFTARLSTFLQMVSRQEDPDTLFFNRSLTIQGDTELGLLIKNMLDAIA